MAAGASDDEIDTSQTLPKKKLSGKKLVLYVVLPILVLAGVGGGLFATGILGGLLGGTEEVEADAGEEEDPAAAAPAEPVGPGYFYDLPNIIVNLNTGERQQHLLAISVSLELGSELDVPNVERVLPRILDNFQVYLRELEVEDLRGSAGLYRLREELQRRVSAAAAPAVVRDVLFREMLIQ